MGKGNQANSFLGVHVVADQQSVDSIREKALSTSNESPNRRLEAFKTARHIPVVVAEMSSKSLLNFFSRIRPVYRPCTSPLWFVKELLSRFLFPMGRRHTCRGRR